MELGFEQFLVGEHGFILGDHGGGEAAAEAILDDFGVLGGAEQQANGGIFVGLAVVAVEGFEVEVDLTEVLRAEFANLQLDGDEAVHAAMEEQQIEREILSADLDGILGADEAEVPSQLSDEAAQIAQESPFQIRLGMLRGQAEEFEGVDVFEELGGLGVQLSQRW